MKLVRDESLVDGGSIFGRRRLVIAYQVWDLGSALSEPDFSMVNLRGPSLPCRSLKPLTGIREVPVANCNKRDFCSASQLRMHCFWVRVLLYSRTGVHLQSRNF